MTRDVPRLREIGRFMLTDAFTLLGLRNPSVAEEARSVPTADVSSWERAIRTLLDLDGAFDLGELQAMNPQDVAALTPGQLMELLAGVPRGPQKAGVVRALAGWWTERFQDSCDPEWTTSLEDDRASLRAIRGIGPETADRILLFAGRRAVMPIDRGTLRIAVRHGWMALGSDDAEWQAHFVQNAAREGVDLAAMSIELKRVAGEFCGRVPNCAECPLRLDLPPGGPLNPDAC